MNEISRKIVLIIIIMLYIIFTLVSAGTSIIGITEDDYISDDDDLSFVDGIPVPWARIPVHQLSILLRLGISIFALFVVYLGGRSKTKRFNDRTIDLIKSLIRVFSETALANKRAVFNFFNLDQKINQLINVFLPIVNSYVRR